MSALADRALGGMFDGSLGLLLLVDPELLGRGLWWISAVEQLLAFVDLGFGLVLEKLGEVVMELLPKDLLPQLTFQRLQWEKVVCSPVIFLLVVFF